MKKLHSAGILLRVSCSTHLSGIHFTQKNKGKTVIEYKILKYRKLKLSQMILRFGLLFPSFFCGLLLIIELSKYIWDLTSAHKVPTIKWSIVRKIHGNTKSDFCTLCLTEKYFILNDLGDNMD